MCTNEVHVCTDIYFNNYIPSTVRNAIALMEDLEEPRKIYECASCGQKIVDLYREQYSKGYNSLRATYTVSFAFEFAASWIDRCFQTGFDDYKGSLEWFEQVEKNERIVKALEKNNVEDDEYKYMLEIVQRWKQLGEMAREWESKKEDIDYFIKSMKNMVAILELLHADDGDVSRIKLLFCDNSAGWHRPSEI